MNIDKAEVGKRIFTIRKSLGLTMKEFGELLGDPIASDSIVSRWEKGKSLPNNERLKKIAELGSIEVEELLLGKDNIEIYIENTITTHIENFPFSESEREFLNKIKDDVTPLLIQRIHEYGKDVSLVYLTLYLEDRLENIADIHSSAFSLSVFDITFKNLNFPKIQDDLKYIYKNINSLDESDLSKVFTANTSTKKSTKLDNEQLYKSMLEMYKQHHSIEEITDFYLKNLIDSSNSFTKEDIQFLISKALENSI